VNNFENAVAEKGQTPFGFIGFNLIAPLLALGRFI
jgi:hypothetical protein